ncbi:unnamed protein product, partial [Meganyctiphanes norvegica]
VQVAKASVCHEGQQCSCREGFIKVDKQCIMFDSNRYTWQAANRVCSSKNATLGTIESFKKLVRPMKNAEIPEEDYWLGITKSTGLEFFWFQNKGQVRGPWAAGQPNYSLGCVVMCWRNTNMPQLCSKSCTTATQFVCTYDIESWANSG